MRLTDLLVDVIEQRVHLAHLVAGLAEDDDADSDGQGDGPLHY